MLKKKWPQTQKVLTYLYKVYFKHTFPDESSLVSLTECFRFIKDCMVAVGTPNAHAEALAELLTEADYRGHYSHGMNRLGNHI